MTGRPRSGIFDPAHRVLTAGIISVMTLVGFEALAVTTAMPFAVRALHGVHWYPVAFGGYLTASIVALIVAGDRSDSAGSRPVFVAGLAFFAAGLIASGAAPGITFFIAGRAIAGFGAGLIIIPLYVLAARGYPEDSRPAIFAAMANAWVIPAVAGPALAGLLVQVAGWRYVFFGVSAPALMSGVILLPRMSLPPPAREGPGTPSRTSARTRASWAAIAALGVAVAQYAAQQSGRTLVLLAGLAACLLGPSVPRLLPRGTLSARRGIPALVLLRGLLASAFFGTEAFLPLLLVSQRHLPALLTGLAITGGSAAWALGSWLQARPRPGADRIRLVVLGSAALALGIGLAALAAVPWVPAGAAGGGWMLAGLGMGLSLTVVNAETLRLSPAGQQGVNSSALQFSDVLGSALCIAIVGAVSSAAAPRLGSYAFVPLFAFTGVIAVAGIVLAPRARLAGGSQSGGELAT